MADAAAATSSSSGDATTPAASGSKVSRRVPCKARNTSDDHDANSAYFVIPPNPGHGLPLKCSHPECTKVKFRFCSVCGVPVAKRNFPRRHGHGLVPPNSFLDDDENMYPIQVDELGEPLWKIALQRQDSQKGAKEETSVTDGSQDNSFTNGAKAAGASAGTGSCFDSLIPSSGTTLPSTSKQWKPEAHDAARRIKQTASQVESAPSPCGDQPVVATERRCRRSLKRRAEGDAVGALYASSTITQSPLPPSKRKSECQRFNQIRDSSCASSSVQSKIEATVPRGNIVGPGISGENKPIQPARSATTETLPALTAPIATQPHEPLLCGMISDELPAIPKKFSGNDTGKRKRGEAPSRDERQDHEEEEHILKYLDSFVASEALPQHLTLLDEDLHGSTDTNRYDKNEFFGVAQEDIPIPDDASFCLNCDEIEMENIFRDDDAIIPGWGPVAMPSTNEVEETRAKDNDNAAAAQRKWLDPGDWANRDLQSSNPRQEAARKRERPRSSESGIEDVETPADGMDQICQLEEDEDEGDEYDDDDKDDVILMPVTREERKWIEFFHSRPLTSASHEQLREWLGAVIHSTETDITVPQTQRSEKRDVPASPVCYLH